jgi:hypothetical protein
MRPTTVLPFLLTTGLTLTGCAAEGPLNTADISDESDATWNHRSPPDWVRDCGMDSCAPIGTIISTQGALYIPVDRSNLDSRRPRRSGWSPRTGEMVRFHVVQDMERSGDCDEGNCGAYPDSGVCEVIDQDGRLLWRQYGEADMWVHARGVESIRTRAVTGSDAGGADEYCDVREVEVVRVPTAPEAQLSCATYFASDFTVPVTSELALNGEASQIWDDDGDGYLRLVKHSIWFPGREGAALSLSAINDPAWQAQFDFEMGGGSGGADGLTFAILDARKPDVVGEDGSGLGVEGLYGYAVEFDTYENDNDPDGNHLALIDTLTGEHLAWASDIPELSGTGTHHAEIRYNNGSLRVWLDGVMYISFTLHDIPNFVQPAAMVGFTAGSGSKTNNHTVDNVIIRPLCDGGASSSGSSEGWAGTVSQAEWAHYGPIELDSGTLVVTMTGTGDADLYVREGAKPTKGRWDCRPYAGSSDEECRIEGPGIYYISVRGYAPSSTYALSVDIVERSSEDGGSGTLAPAEWAHFGPFEIDAGALVATMTGTGDADLYIRDGAEPTVGRWDCRPYQVDSDETCCMEGPGTYFVSVRGYAQPTSSFELAVDTGRVDCE